MSYSCLKRILIIEDCYIYGLRPTRKLAIKKPAMPIKRQKKYCCSSGVRSIQKKVTLKSLTCLYHFPSTKAIKAIPSPIIANLIGLTDRTIHSSKSTHVSAIELNTTIADLKTLSFQSFYFEKNRQLAPDAIFWIEASQLIAQSIRQDQYIPELVAQRKKNKLIYHTKWSLLSPELLSSFKAMQQQLPRSGYIFTNGTLDQESLLVNYADSALNQLIVNTPMTQKLEKLVGNTFIEKALLCQPTSADENLWKECRLWRNNLNYDQFGSPFNLCFRLNAAQFSDGDDWSLEILMQSKDEPGFMINASEYWQTQKEKKALYNKMLGTSAQKTLLLQLGYASRVLPMIEIFFDYNMKESLIPLSTKEAFQFLKEDAWALKASGYRIIVPSWWTSKGRLKAKVKLKASRSETEMDSPTSYFDRESLVNFNYQLAMGGYTVTLQEWQALLNSSESLVYFRGEWMEIDLKEMEKIQALVQVANTEQDIGTIKDLLIKAADDEMYDVELDNHIQETLDKLTGKQQLSLLKPPNGLLATLRPYQVRGVIMDGFFRANWPLPVFS